MDDGRIIGWRTFLQRIWRWLRQPWLLLISSGIIILLVLVARTIPQLPSLLINDPAATARWLRTVNQGSGARSELLQLLGLFDVLHSPLLRLLMLFMGLLLAVQFAEQIGVLRQVRALPALLNNPPASVGAPLLQDSAVYLHRERFVVESAPNEAATHYTQQMPPQWGAPMRVESMHAGSQDAPVDNEAEENARLAEIRLLWLHNWPFAYLRLLLIGGILLALITVWSIAQQSWQISPFLLAPGDAVRYGALGLGLSYETGADSTMNRTAAEQRSAANAITIAVQLGELRRTLLVGQNGSALRMGQVTIAGALGPPGLQVHTDDSERLLARPNQAGVADNIGLVFPNEGDEKFILIPTESVALRIVRATRSQTPYFLVEVFNQSALGEGNAQPVQRFEVVQSQAFDLPLADEPLTLHFDPHPSVRLQAHSLPGLWLLWPVTFAILVGGVSLVRRPSFQLIQIAPWPHTTAEGAAVIIWQSSEKLAGRQDDRVPAPQDAASSQSEASQSEASQSEASQSEASQSEAS